MVVDDNEANTAIAEVLLNGLGLSVLIAHSGSQAIGMLKKIKALKGALPSAILMDYKMPDMDGIEAARHIRDLGLSMPIIMYSDTPGQEPRQMAATAGANFWLNKAATSAAEDLRKALQSVGVIP